MACSSEARSNANLTGVSHSLSMSAVVDNGSAKAPSPLSESAQRTNQDHYSQKCHLDQVDAPEQQQASLGSYSPYRVANMLKEKKLRPMARDSRECSPINSDSENSYMHSNGRDTSPKMRYPGNDGSISPRYGLNHLNNNNNNSISESNMHDLSSHHPISMTRKDLMMTAENSKVLRGILQGKDFQERHQMVDNGIESIDDDSREISPGDTREGSISGEFSMDRDSMRSVSRSPGGMSSDGSDQENNMNNLNGMHSMDEDMRMDGGMDFSPENYCPNSEGLEAKRARVENIISSMRVSPLKSLNDTSGMGDARRPKRKQYIPQQHDIYMEHSTPKIRRQDKDVLVRQVKQIQEQLTAIKSSHPELFDGDCQEPLELCTDSAELSQAKKEVANMKDILKDRSFVNFSGRGESLLKSDENSNTETVELVKEACKLMKEHQSDFVKNSFALNSAMPDLTNLAKVLKAELSSSVENLVDNVVARFLVKQAKKDSLKETEKVPAPAVKELKPPPVRDTIISAPAVTSHTSSHSNISTHNNIINITPSAITTTSPSLRPPALITANAEDSISEPFQFPKPTRTKVTDKITHPFFDMHTKPFFELPRTHAPLFAPPPYYHQALPHLQPLFPKEPEQTEALPLVVNTPKKKRTKVTDTRLSPRAARALLQDGLSPGIMQPELDKIRALAGEYPGHPLMPVSLPTSVAIPNPSLQQHDVMALYHQSRQNSFSEFKQAIQSPIMSMADHASPNTPHSSCDPLFKNELENMYNNDHLHHHHHMGEGTTFDGHPIVSFSIIFTINVII